VNRKECDCRNDVFECGINRCDPPRYQQPFTRTALTFVLLHSCSSEFHTLVYIHLSYIMGKYNIFNTARWSSHKVRKLARHKKAIGDMVEGKVVFPKRKPRSGLSKKKQRMMDSRRKNVRNAQKALKAAAEAALAAGQDPDMLDVEAIASQAVVEAAQAAQVADVAMTKARKRKCV
jgi:nucleotide-binding universal stress UspA family protein